jgi:uncharacterized membrane protein
MLFLTILITVSNIICDLRGLSFFQISLSSSLILFIPLLFLILHSIWTLSFFRGILFILTACFTGFIFEFIGLKYNTIFGGNYLYFPEGIKIFTVPLNIILCWGVFIYIGYCITNSFLYWLNKEKPSENNKVVLKIPLLILFDSLIVVAIDLFMDPLQVKAGSWVWQGGGHYFGIPIGNFIGWMIVTAITTGSFRIYEYFKPIDNDIKEKSIFLIPVVGYGILYLYFFVSALKMNMTNLAFIGSLTMLPIIVFNLFLFTKFIKSNFPSRQ